MKIKHTNQRAFTIVELLIVIVVIGILAAIVIVAYNGVQSRARASAASSALTQAAKKIALWQVDNPGVSPTALSDAGVTDSSSVSYQYSQTLSGTGYCITATVGTTSYYLNTTPTSQGTPTQGGCAGHGVGGVGAVTNLALNPNAEGSTAAFGYAGTPAAATRTISSDMSHDGTTSLKTVISGTGQTGAQAKVPASTVRLNVGDKLSWSFWIYSTKAGSIVPYIDGSKVADGTYAGGSSATVTVPANVWTKVTGTFTASAADIYASQVGGYNLQVVSGDIVWFDSFIIEKGGTLHTFADGSSPNWVWDGTPNNSTSTGPPL